jgi:predicted O-methyltransferase YrrM
MKLEWRDVSIGDGPAISTSLTLNETAELQRLAKGAEVLEIGSAFGYSTVVLASVADLVVAVDPHQALRSLEALRANLGLYGVRQRVDIRVGRSQDFLPGMVKGGRRFDLVWIDGDHEAIGVAYDLTWSLQLLRPTGTLAVHDYGEDTCPDVRLALDAWKVPPRLVDTLAIYGPGEW